MSENTNKPFTCPQCGGQNLTISQRLIYGRYFSIEDGIMFGMSEPQIETQGETWIDCTDCRQDEEFEDGREICEWIASEEEKKLIWAMRDKASNPTDVSEFINKDEENG